MKSRLTAAYLLLRNTLSVSYGLADYRRILLLAQRAGYRFYTLGEFAEMVRSQTEPSQPFILLRHDIDTDCKTAHTFACIEHSLGIRASYFFRLNTWKVNLIKKIAELGHEPGYHFEELATHALERHLKDQKDILAELPAIKKAFSANLHRLRSESGLALKGCASHGDFANRKLGLTNRPILADQSFRSQLAIDYEAYDQDLLKVYGLHVSDKPYPSGFEPECPKSLIKKRISFLLLTHPRWWKLNIAANLRESLNHFWKGLTW